MKLFRPVNFRFRPGIPPIKWAGDVRGIIAASRTAERAAFASIFRSPDQSGVYQNVGVTGKTDGRRTIRLVAPGLK